MKKAKTIDNYVVDFPYERAELKILELQDGRHKYIFDHTINNTNIIMRKDAYGKEKCRIEYDRQKAILDNCFDIYIQAKLKDYMTFPYKKKE